MGNRQHSIIGTPIALMNSFRWETCFFTCQHRRVRELRNFISSAQLSYRLHWTWCFLVPKLRISAIAAKIPSVLAISPRVQTEKFDSECEAHIFFEFEFAARSSQNWEIRHSHQQAPRSCRDLQLHNLGNYNGNRKHTVHIFIAISQFGEMIISAGAP